jgi:DNA-binding NarL/FixJ family response regulator
MSGGSRSDGRELAASVPAAWQRFLHSGESVAAHGSVRADGAELPVDVLARVEFLDERRVDVHLVLAEDEPDSAEAAGRLLTRRERAVVALIARGLETREIADTLYVSTATVKTHVRNAMEKLGAHTRAQLVAVALTGRSAGADPCSGDRAE